MAGGARLHFLRFDPEREARFQAEYTHSTLRYVRVGGGLLAALHIIGLIGAPPIDLLDALRAVVLAVEALGFVALTWWTKGRRWLQAALVVVALSGLANVSIDAANSFAEVGSDHAAMAALAATYTLYLTVGFFLLYTLFRLRFWYCAFTCLTATAVWLAWLTQTAAAGLVDQDSVVLSAVMLVSANLIGLAANYSIESAARRDFELRHEIAAERAKSDRLLYQMLPESVANRLREGRGPVAENVSEVTVLFADLSGFTPLSLRLVPDEVIVLLNRIFFRFDQLARSHGVEKIVTTGDGFIAVGGVPTWRPDHAEAVADLALDMQTAVGELNTELGTDLRVRIGINTGGPVVAGVIGTTKYLYSIVGDAMNTASRMESHGVPGCIQVSEATYARLKQCYALEERGLIDVKGKGPMRTYWLTARRQQQHAFFNSHAQPPLRKE